MRGKAALLLALGISLSQGLVAAEWRGCVLADFEQNVLRRLVLRTVAWPFDWGLQRVARDQRFLILMHPTYAGYCDVVTGKCEGFQWDSELDRIEAINEKVTFDDKGIHVEPLAQSSSGGYRGQASASDLVLTIPGSSAVITDPLKDPNFSRRDPRVKVVPPSDFSACSLSAESLFAFDKVLQGRPLPVARPKWASLKHVEDFVRGMNVLKPGVEVRVAPFYSRDPYVLVLVSKPGESRKVYALFEWHQNSFKVERLKFMYPSADYNQLVRRILSTSVATLRAK